MCKGIVAAVNRNFAIYIKLSQTSANAFYPITTELTVSSVGGKRFHMDVVPWGEEIAVPNEEGTRIDNRPAIEFNAVELRRMCDRRNLLDAAFVRGKRLEASQTGDFIKMNDIRRIRRQANKAIEAGQEKTRIPLDESNLPSDSTPHMHIGKLPDRLNVAAELRELYKDMDVEGMFDDATFIELNAFGAQLEATLQAAHQVTKTGWSTKAQQLGAKRDRNLLTPDFRPRR